MASRNRVPEVKGFAITVAMPLHRPIATPKKRDSHYWEVLFEEYSEEEIIPDYKENFKRCKDMIKLADSFWGSLENVTNGKNINEGSSIEFTFRFEDIKSLTSFMTTLWRI